MSTFPSSRKGSGRPISRGAVQMGAVGKAANQTVEIADRPMSTHGMTGTRAATGTRQVRDSTYFATELLNKIQATNRERDALQASSTELRRRAGVAGRLAESVDELRKQVTALQGELHDTTHAQTRTKEGASLDDLRADAASAEEQAGKLRSDANVAFRARQEALQRLEKNEATAAKLRADTEQRIFNDLGEEAARQFRQVNAENAELERKEQELRQKLTEQANTTAQAYAAAFVLQPQQSQQNVQRAVDLHRQLRAAAREVETLRNELQKDAADDPEAGIRNQLRQQLKQESNNVHKLAEECKQIEAALGSRKRLLTEITPDVMTTISKEQKDMIRNVLRAEKQLQEWPRQRAEIVQSNQVLQGKVMALMNRLPAPLVVGGAGEDAGSVEQSLSLKTRELERLSDQEGRVLTELQQVNQRVQSISDALSALQQAVGDAEAVEDVEVAEKELREELAQQVEEHKALQAKLGEVNGEINDLEEKLQNNEQVQALRSLYDALAAQLSKQYAAEAYIRSREAETNYQKDKDFCLNLLNQINSELAKLDRPA